MKITKTLSILFFLLLTHTSHSQTRLDSINSMIEGIVDENRTTRFQTTVADWNDILVDIYDFVSLKGTCIDYVTIQNNTDRQVLKLIIL